MAYEYKNLLVTVENHVGTLLINRPEMRNALNEETMDEMRAALVELDNDPAVHVIVLAGAGEKAFCAGGDLNNMLDAMKQNSIIIRRFTSGYANLVKTILAVSKPTIASVQGFAFAGGCGLAVVCDLTIASEKAQFCLSEINIGIWGAIISAPIIRTVGMKKAKEMLFTGRRFKADQALEMGLVNTVVPAEELAATTKAWADEIASKSPLALKMGKEALHVVQDMEINQAFSYLQNMVALLMGSDDANEGISSFLEKRSPEWKNK